MNLKTVLTWKSAFLFNKNIVKPLSSTEVLDMYVTGCATHSLL